MEQMIKLFPDKTIGYAIMGKHYESNEKHEKAL